jgi:hypothetical protein
MENRLISCAKRDCWLCEAKAVFSLHQSPAMFKSFLYIACLLVVISSCSTPYVVRNYEYAPPNCDCYVYGNDIGFGGTSSYSYRQKAWCNKLNYWDIRDSLSLLESQSDSLEEITPDETSLQRLRTDSLLNIYKQWTSCKIKMHVKTQLSVINDSTISEVTVRRKITFYRRGLFRYKKIRKAKYLNDKLLKSKEK